MDDNIFSILIGATAAIITAIGGSIAGYLKARADFEKSKAEAKDLNADTKTKLMNADLNAQQIIIKNLGEQYDKVVTRLDVVEDELNQLRDEVYSLREERDDLKDRVQQLEEEREQNRDEINQLRKRIETLEAELAQKNAYIQQLERERGRL